MSLVSNQFELHNLLFLVRRPGVKPQKALGLDHIIRQSTEESMMEKNRLKCRARQIRRCLAVFERTRSAHPSIQQSDSVKPEKDGYSAAGTILDKNCAILIHYALRSRSSPKPSVCNSAVILIFDNNPRSRWGDG